MPTYEKTIHEIIKKTNAKGEYLEIKIDGKDGEIWESKVFGEAVKEITQPGRYSIDYEARVVNGKKYMNIARAMLLEAKNGHQEASKMLKTAQEGPSPLKVRAVGRDTTTAREILVQVVLKAAADIYSGAGKLMPEPDAIALEKLVKAMAENLLSWADKKLSNHIENEPF